MYTAHQVQNEHQHIIHDLRLIDNDFMNLCLNFNPACIHLILQLLIQEDHLDTQFIQTQYFMQNLTERSLCLDIFVKDELNRYFDIEFQRSNNGADKKRARYHASMMDTHVLAKGNDFKQLKDIYVIFITEHDVLGKGKPLYHIERKIRETGELFEDGIHILYVNASYQDDTPIGRLMHDLMCADPDEMHYEVLADTVRHFKHVKEGKKVMCEALEEMKNKARNEGKAEGVMEGKLEGKIEGRKEKELSITLRMLKSGNLSLNQIAQFLDISIDDVKQIAQAHAMESIA